MSLALAPLKSGVLAAELIQHCSIAALQTLITPRGVNGTPTDMVQTLETTVHSPSTPCSIERMWHPISPRPALPRLALSDCAATRGGRGGAMSLAIRQQPAPLLSTAFNRLPLTTTYRETGTRAPVCAQVFCLSCLPPEQDPKRPNVPISAHSFL